MDSHRMDVCTDSANKPRRTRLVISRKIGESVHVGGATITVTESQREGHTRLLIEAPPEVRILRDELVKHGSE